MLPTIAICYLAYVAFASAEVDLITEPRPGEEFVLVSSGIQGPKALSFESSHKIPEKLPQRHVFRTEETNLKSWKSKPAKTGGPNKTNPLKGHENVEGIIAIEEIKKNYDKNNFKQKPTESIEVDIPFSKFEQIKIQDTVNKEDVNAAMKVSLEAMSESGKFSDIVGSTTQKPILTTAPTTKGYDIIPINFDSIDDINSGLLSSNVNVEAAGSEQKQHSRIQIKKGPNGQDYEYEYIYYYYDDDDEPKTNKTEVSSTEVHNAHDGPQKVDSDNHISKDNKNKNRYSVIDRSHLTTTTATSTTNAAVDVQNEVVPSSSRNRFRGRNLTPAPVQEEIIEERLPASTRFPPRSRNLNTSPTQEVSGETNKRGKTQSDSVADESIGQTRSRPRAHVRRPSSELVDLASFNTQSGDISLSQYKELQTRFNAEKSTEPESTKSSLVTEHDTVAPRRGHSLSNIIKFQEILDESKLPPDYKPTTIPSYDTTEFTTMTAMEKVALDLYAYLAGENVNDINTTGDYVVTFDGSTTELSENSGTTEMVSTTEDLTTITTTTSTTTTTTTTTTTPAPTTTQPTSVATARPSRFKIRPGSRGRTSSTTTTDAPAETSTKAKGRFNRPSFAGRRTSTAAPDPAAAEEKAFKQEDAPLTASKPIPGRNRFGSRSKFSTAATSAATPAADSISQAAQPVSARPRLRPSFNHRKPGGAAPSSTAPAAEESASVSSLPAAEVSSETPVSSTRGIGRGRPLIRPLRPGPRLNLGKVTPSTPSSAPSDAPPNAPVDAASSPAPEEHKDEPLETTPAGPLSRLRGRQRLQVAPTPRPRASSAPPPRRPNPLIRRRPGASESPEPATEAPEAPATEQAEPSTGAESKVEATVAEVPEPTEATQSPRGISSLIARRRLATRRPGSL